MGVPVKKKGGKKPARPRQQLTAEEHYENAEMAFAMENFDQARTSFKKALDMEPENCEYLEGYGSFLAEVGPQQEALAVLQKAAQLQPDEGFEKFMYLGQLLEGAEAEQCVRKGITILREHVQQQGKEPAAEAGSEEAAEQAAIKQHLDSTLASCLCSLVEVLMNKGQASEQGISSVEAECEQLLGEARSLVPSSPEPLQALASLRQQQGKEEEALALLRQSLALWFKPLPEDSDEEGEEGEGEKKKEAEGGAAAEAEAAAAGGKAGKAAKGSKEEEAEEEELGSQDTEGSEEDEDEEMEWDSDDEGQLMPSYEFRFEAAKLLLELDESVETASQVLEQLLEENDQDPNVWLLLALCCQGGGDLEGALGAVIEGLDLCKKLRLPSDDEMVGGFEAMQTELKAMLEAEAKQGGGEEGGDQ